MKQKRNLKSKVVINIANYMHKTCRFVPEGVMSIQGEILNRVIVTSDELFLYLRDKLEVV